MKRTTTTSESIASFEDPFSSFGFENESKEDTDDDDDITPVDTNPPVATCHGQQWRMPIDPRIPTNGQSKPISWGFRTTLGEVFGAGSDARKEYTAYDYFMMMFPSDQLKVMLDLTNFALLQVNQKPTTAPSKRPQRATKCLWPSSERPWSCWSSSPSSRLPLQLYCD